MRSNSIVSVTGQITWIPGPNPAPWIVLTIAVAVAIASFSWRSRWTSLLGFAVGALIAVDAINTVASVATIRDSTVTVAATTISRDPLTTLAWIAAFVGIALLHVNAKAGVALAAVVGWTITVSAALSDFGAFDSSQLPTRLEAELARFYVALTLGLGTGVALAGIIVASRANWISLPGFTGRRQPRRR